MDHNLFTQLMLDYFPNVNLPMMWDNTLITLTMLGLSWFFTLFFGLLMGILLYLLSPGQLLEHRGLYPTLSLITNILRSIPFIILIVVLLPITKNIMGSAFGVRGVIFPLIVGATPFFAKLTESALREVDRGVIEAAESMGAPLRTIIWRVLIPEALPSLIAAATITAILLLSFTAMAGVVGGNGLGDLAVRYGFHRKQADVANFVVIILIIIAQTIQFTGNRLMLHFTRK